MVVALVSDAGWERAAKDSLSLVFVKTFADGNPFPGDGEWIGQWLCEQQEREGKSRHSYFRAATTSISICAPPGSAATPRKVRAGRGFGISST